MAKRVRCEPVDWSKVPVVIVGTPNQEALRALWEDVVDAQVEQAVNSDQSAVISGQVVERVSLVSVPSSTE